MRSSLGTQSALVTTTGDWVMDVIIIGAGPAAAGAALALTASPNVSVRVLDVGGRLEERNDEVRVRMSQSDPSEWSSADVDVVSRVPKRPGTNACPRRGTSDRTSPSVTLVSWPACVVSATSTPT